MPVNTNKSAKTYSIIFFVLISSTNFLNPLPKSAQRLMVGKHITAALICFPTISLWALFGSGLRKFVGNIKTKKIIEYVLALLLVLTGIFILIK